jgi:hypothetical protein
VRWKEERVVEEGEEEEEERKIDQRVEGKRPR